MRQFTVSNFQALQRDQGSSPAGPAKAPEGDLGNAAEV